MQKKIENPVYSAQALRKLIIPLVLEQALSMMVGLADTVMISSAGEAAVSGVSLVDMINILIFSIFSALATGGAVVTSQLIGARKEKEGCRTTNQLLYTMLILSVVITAFILVFRAPLLRLAFGEIEEDVRQNALLYLIITAMSFPFLAVYNACAALFRAMGDSRTTLKVSVVMNLINVAGNAIGIYVLRMGVAGVAIPSVLSRIYAAAALFILLWNQKRMIHFEKEPIRLNLPVIRKILYIGVPSGVENGIFQLGKIVVVSIVAGFGTIQIAANSVANSLQTVSVVPGMAIGLAMITVIGTCVGAQDEEQIRYFTKKLMLISYISVASLMGIIILGRPLLLRLYDLQSETLDLAATVVLIHNGGGMLLWPAAFVLPNMLRASNDVRYTMTVSVVSMIVFRVGMSFLLGKYLGLGVIGVTIAMDIDWVCRAVFFIGRYLSGRWKKLAGLPEQSNT